VTLVQQKIWHASWKHMFFRCYLDHFTAIRHNNYTCDKLLQDSCDVGSMLYSVLSALEFLAECDFYPTPSIFPTFSAMILSTLLMLTLKGRRWHYSKTFSGSIWLVKIAWFWKHFQQFCSCRTCCVILQGTTLEETAWSTHSIQLMQITDIVPKSFVYTA